MSSLFPSPRLIAFRDNTKPFVIHPKTTIITLEASIGQLLKDYLTPALGFDLKVYNTTLASQDDAIGDAKSRIVLELDEESYNNNNDLEKYLLNVTETTLLLQAPTLQGLVHGIQTIRQLLPSQIMQPPTADNDHTNERDDVVWSIPCVYISDAPAFSWRGLHLDVGRHMFPVDFIKKYIDLMAFYKLNVFHLHLTEDQGWRVEIQKHPKLMGISAFRKETPIPEDRAQGDGTPYGGYYTQEEIREIVAYASARHITIVPEIELPGHTVAVLAAYPELGCVGHGEDGGDYQVRTTWGVAEDVFCAGKEEVFTFLQDVLEEVIDLFPGEYIHIGGDDCPKTRCCPHCQARIQKENLADEFELQSWFIRRIEGWLLERGRKIVGWDEILEGGVSPSATVMSWRGSKGGIKAATAGNDVIMTPNTHCYLDYYQSTDRDQEPAAIGGHLPLEQVYEFEVIPKELPAERAHHILGGQGNVWTEYMTSSVQVEYMAFPRAIALSEVLWSHPEQRDFMAFEARLKEHLPHLEAIPVNFRPFK